MTSDVVVSVITPCLNPGDWLRRCLDSISAQTYPHVEHIVVDGGSTDGTVELLRSRGVTFISEPDSGQANAINKGFRLAQGALMGWVNADDVLLPDAVQAIVDAFDADTSVGWVYGRCQLQRNRKRQVLLPPPRRIGRTTLDFGNLLAQPGFFMARSALEQIGELDESFHLGMDFDLWLRLIDARIPAAYVPRVLAIYEVHELSKTGSTHPSEFVREWAHALLKSGRKRQAAFAFGRAAAASAGSARGSLEPAEVTEVVERLLADPGMSDLELDRRAVVAGAQVEAAIVELHHSPLGLRHLLRPNVWRYRETRRRLSLAARFAIYSPIMAVRNTMTR